jgi:hypothetical protein
VKALFGSDDGRGAVYVEFCAVLKRYQSRELDARGVERAVAQLFKGATTHCNRSSVAICVSHTQETDCLLTRIVQLRHPAL